MAVSGACRRVGVAVGSMASQAHLLGEIRELCAERCVPKGLGLLVESHDRWTETGRRTDVAVVVGLVGGVAQHERKRLVDDL